MNIFYFFLWIILLRLKRSVGIRVNIFPNGSAFLKFTERIDTQEIIYKQPLEDKLLVSVRYGDLKTSKELERSKYKSQVFTDKENLSFQSNLMKDSFTINSICKFDHDKQAAFALDKVCCEITVKNSDEFGKVLGRKVCKLEISDTSSACYAQLELLKDSFDTQKSSEFEVELNSRVFMSRESKCMGSSSTLNNLAFGYPLRMLVTQGLLVKWELTDVSDAYGHLEIGIPVDSVDVNSKTIFPLKIRSPTAYSMIVIACTFGEELSLSDISFEATKFEGEFKKSLENVVKISLTQKDSGGDSSGGDSIGEHLVNLRVRLLGGRRKKKNRSAKSDFWISCRVERAFSHKSKEPIVSKSEQNTKRVFINVNEDSFIIIPIMKKTILFSTINPIFGPIKLEPKQLKIFNVHSVRDGSLIDITSKTVCKAISNSTLLCPDDTPAGTGQKELMKSPNWNVILSMMSWQKMFSAPFELWQAEDWRLVTSDKVLNKVANWNRPKQSKGGCTPVYQTARARLFARLVKDSVSQDRVYFGQNVSEYPLLDMTPQLARENILPSNDNIEVVLNRNDLLILKRNLGATDLSVVNNLRSKVAVDLIKVDESFVSIADLNVSCIHNLHLNHSSNYDDPSFRSIVISARQARNPNESCYFQILVLFTDGTSADLMDYRHTDFQLTMLHSEGSVTMDNLETFHYEPHKYKDPGRFSINLYESNKCSKNNLIFTKQVDLFTLHTRPSPGPPSTQSAASTSVGQHLIAANSSATRTTTIGVDKGQNMSPHNGIDTDTLFLSMKILIGLVLLVVFIIILNCIIKFRNRKSACLLDRQLNPCQLYGQVEKLTTSTYSPIDMTSENLNNQHPPLLPPPGPLYNHSDSSQLDLAANASPDMFWSFPHSGDSSRDRNMPTNHALVNIPMSSINGSGNSVTFPTMFPSSRRTSPSPHSDNLDYNFVNSSGSKLAHARPGQPNPNGYNYPSGSLNDSDSLASGSGSKTSSQVAAMVPPCPPLRWNTNWNTTQFPIYFPNDKDLSLDPSISQFSNDQSSQNSLTPSNSSSWGLKQPLVLPPIGFNSADNVCEKSSGLGSLSSTQPGSDCSKKDSATTSSPNTTNYSASH